jgi:formate/nitrite transporter FocA (FNT family)
MTAIAVSCFLLSFTAGDEVIEKAKNIVETSVTLSFPSLFVKSVMCGVIMLIAVDRYRNCDGMAKYIAVFVGIPVFILSGYYHSIAYVGYLTLGLCGGNLSDNVTVPKVIYVIIVAVIGNGVGSILTRYLTTSKEK